MGHSPQGSGRGSFKGTGRGCEPPVGRRSRARPPVRTCTVRAGRDHHPDVRGSPNGWRPGRTARSRRPNGRPSTRTSAPARDVWRCWQVFRTERRTRRQPAHGGVVPLDIGVRPSRSVALADALGRSDHDCRRRRADLGGLADGPTGRLFAPSTQVARDEAAPVEPVPQRFDDLRERARAIQRANSTPPPGPAAPTAATPKAAESLEPAAEVRQQQSSTAFRNVRPRNLPSKPVAGAQASGRGQRSLVGSRPPGDRAAAGGPAAPAPPAALMRAETCVDRDPLAGSRLIAGGFVARSSSDRRRAGPRGRPAVVPAGAVLNAGAVTVSNRLLARRARGHCALDHRRLALRVRRASPAPDRSSRFKPQTPAGDGHRRRQQVYIDRGRRQELDEVGRVQGPDLGPSACKISHPLRSRVAESPDSAPFVARRCGGE